jgi:nucleoside-diphosphate-sugar epimerase
MTDKARDPLNEFRRTNVEGTRVVVEEAARAGVTRFVFFSSVKAVGEKNEFPWDETVVPLPVDPYGVSKLEAEELVLSVAKRTDMSASILRLPLAYGPHMKGNMLRLFDAIECGRPLPFGAIRNRRSMVYSGNVAESVLRVLASDQVSLETFFVSDGVVLSTRELVAAVGKALGKDPHLVNVPVPLLNAMGYIGDLFKPILQVPVTSATIRRVTDSLSVDVTKLRRLTGYGPHISVETGLLETAAWYRGAVRRGGDV